MVDKLGPERFTDWIDDGKRMTLIDTRQEESFEAWHAPGAENVPYDPREGANEDQLDEVDAVADGRPVVTICGKGLTSASFAFELDERGYDDVEVVTGGMEGWSKVYEIATVETATEDLVVRQVQRRAKGCLGYVVGSKAAEEAVVVDPTRQVDRYTITAQFAGLAVERVLDTHVHADHLSGGPALAEELGVPYHLGEAVDERNVEQEYDPLSDGETVAVGDVEIEALHTPGHTRGTTSYLVEGELLLPGDTLFVDSVGRTELGFEDGDATRGAELLYDSLHETILDLPDETRILPGHVGVTSDGRYENGSPGDPVTIRLGALRENLDLLGLDREAFVGRLTEDLPEKPPNFDRIVAVNAGRETVDEDEATELELGPNNCAA